jgi:hypothetical protein
MVWFKVDDKLHSHNKIRKVLADDPAALALWTVAGSWSSDNLTDGFVPDHQLPWLLPKGADELAQILVAARLWRRVRGGYQFHEWGADGDGTKRNPTRHEVEKDRRKKVEAGRKGGLASGRTRAGGAKNEKDRGDEPASRKKIGETSEQDPSADDGRNDGTESGEDLKESVPSRADARSEREARASASASPHAKAGAGPLVELPTRPDPKGRDVVGVGLLGGRAVTREDPPSPRCLEHFDDPDPPSCGRCASARKARESWDRERVARAAEAVQVEARERAMASRLAIDACRLCDDRGYVDGAVCHHDPGNADRARRGMAMVRAAANGGSTP